MANCERGTCFKKGVLNHICAQTGYPLRELLEMVDSLYFRGVPKSEIYREIMSGHGLPSTHNSGMRLDCLKRGRVVKNRKRFFKK